MVDPFGFVKVTKGPLELVIICCWIIFVGQSSQIVFRSLPGAGIVNDHNSLLYNWDIYHKSAGNFCVAAFAGS